MQSSSTNKTSKINSKSNPKSSKLSSNPNSTVKKKNPSTKTDIAAGPAVGLSSSEKKVESKAVIEEKCPYCNQMSSRDKMGLNIYEKKTEELMKELRGIYQYKRKLQGDLYKSKFNKDMPEETLIDKCKHFSGNYKPIFDCCHTAYGCYLCHDENECHDYQISKKVICLLCAYIYEGNECPNCKVKQCYQKKEKSLQG